MRHKMLPLGNGSTPLLTGIQRFSNVYNFFHTKKSTNYFHHISMK